jgi:Ca2+-binding EF-hand superfamily protein
MNSVSLIIRSLTLGSALCLLPSCETTKPSTPATPDQTKRFDAADTNHDGLLSKEEVSDTLVTELFEGRDANQNGEVTKEEWVVAGDPAGAKTFAEYDTDKNGVVTLPEAKAHARSKGMADDIVKEADTNKDGFASLDEVRQYYASKEGPIR